LYIKAWFCAPIASLAPFQDLQFLKSLVDYENIHKNISQSTLKKLCGHLWYLAPETAALAFFDTNLTIQTKIKMVDSIKLNNLTSKINKRIIISPNEVTQIMKKEIYDFIYIESTSFFSRFGIPTSFLEQHPSMWDENEDYQKGLEIVNTFRVTNDTAKRGVKLMEQYNKVLTKNEDQKQYVLQVVEDYRHKYPNSLKTTVLKPL
jgi:adenylate/nucleoside-diphosphate kinase